VNRALRAAALGVLLFSPVALTACGAGQITQTESQARDKTGPTAQVGDIVLRGVQLAYPSGGSYDSGDDAELQLAIVNRGNEDDSLVDVSGDDFSRVRITGGGTAAGSGDSSSGGPEVEIPAKSALYLGREGPTVTLENLSESLTPGQTIELTLEFDKAGEVTVPAQVGTSDRPVARGEAYDFHDEGQNSGEAGTESGG
jgi:copper(I)-binding protein